MLAQGGNAVDAVVAAAAAIGVAEPYMSGLAGCGTLVLTPPGGTPRVLVFLGRAPSGATPDRFTGGHPDAGPLTPAVPGNLAGWARVLSDYGKLSLSHVLEPAIELAERGVPFTPFDKQTGAIKYRLSNELASYADPVVATIDGRRECFVFTRGGLLALEPTAGREEFFFPWRAQPR